MRRDYPRLRTIEVAAPFLAFSDACQALREQPLGPRCPLELSSQEHCATIS